METGSFPEERSLTEVIYRFLDGSAPVSDAQVIYQMIIGLAQRVLGGRSERIDVSRTVLANEALLRLLKHSHTWENREHFFSTLARCMKQIIVDLLRKASADKRNNGGSEAVSCDDVECSSMLSQLSQLESYLHSRADDAQLCTIIELKFFVGLSDADIANGLSCSERTVKRKWAQARADLTDHFLQSA